ncbi:MAG: hypothetical protein ACI39E_06105 [Acutalibacteraceae bacterium]
MKKTIGIQTIVELNALLKEKELPFLLHLCDRCGGQFVRIERLAKTDEQQEHDFSQLLCDTLAKERLSPCFYTDVTGFTVQ